MTTRNRRRTNGSRLVLMLAGLISASAFAGPALGVGPAPAPTASEQAQRTAVAAAPTARISGEGSSWAGNAVEDWKVAVRSQGVTVDYNPNGSSTGRKDFALGLADFAVSEIPYKGDTSDPQDRTYPDFPYALVPAVAGGTSFMYNVPVNGQRYEDLRLSQSALAKIFTGQVTRWNDPAIRATNPGVNLPAQRITVVVRSDGSGATAQFTLWLKRQFPREYRALCDETGCNPNAATSYFPYQGLDNFTAQSGSAGVTTYTANTPYTINYDEYSYAQGVGFPVALVQNAAGYFIEPTDTAVAVALTQAKINNDKSSDDYLSQDLSAVYPYQDPRAYPLSAYSYLIEPTRTHDNFTTAKGETLAYFEQFVLCEGQQTMGRLGYSPLPMNLVLAALDQVLKVPGISSSTKQAILDTKQGVKSGNSNPCNNPTFRPGESPSHNVLVETAPFPEGCDAACQAPWIGRTGEGPPTDSGDDPDGPGNQNNDPNDQNGGPDDPTDQNGDGLPDTDPGDQECDPDTGLCTGDTTATGADEPQYATPQVLDGTGTWGTAQLALAISVLFVLALVFGPPLAARALDGRGGPRRPTGPPVSAEPAAPTSDTSPGPSGGPHDSGD